MVERVENRSCMCTLTAIISFQCKDDVLGPNPSPTPAPIQTMVGL